MKKFTMELVWHNCWECPPEEAANDFLIMTDGVDIFEGFWYRPDGFMIRAKDGWHGVYENQDKWYWADIRQTVRGDVRFKGLIVDDLVDDFKSCASLNLTSCDVYGGDSVIVGGYVQGNTLKL